MQRGRRVKLTHDQCWAPKPILGSVRFLLTDRRMYSVVGYLKQITEAETDNFPVGYSVGYFTWTVFLCHVRTPMGEKKKNLVRVGRHVGTSPYNRITCIARRTTRYVRKRHLLLCRSVCCCAVRHESLAYSVQRTVPNDLIRIPHPCAIKT